MNKTIGTKMKAMIIFGEQRENVWEWLARVNEIWKRPSEDNFQKGEATKLE